nr:protein krueppel-like [Parasteatoda tepidariorum]
MGLCNLGKIVVEVEEGIRILASVFEFWPWAESIYDSNLFDAFVRFSFKNGLKSHSFVHTTDKPYSCIVCNKRFTQKHQLKAHNLVHSKEKIYSCSMCSMSFTEKHHLISNTFVHTKEKPFTCGICQRSFSL